MPRPTTRAELLDAMEIEFLDLLAQVDEVPLEHRCTPGACEHWSLKDLLAHLDAWHGLFLGWERAGTAGADPQMPAPGYTWKQIPELNAAIWERTKDDSYADVEARLQRSYVSVRAVIEGYGDDLFDKGVAAWTGTTSVGAYAVSATSSHYAWARKLVKRFGRSIQSAPLAKQAAAS